MTPPRLSEIRKRASEATPEYFWVPEGCVFDSAPDCLGKFPDYGPACLVAQHVRYDDAKRDIAHLLATVEKLKEHLEYYAEPSGYIPSRTFYGDKNAWVIEPGSVENYDKGKRARQALREIEGEE